MDREDLRLAIYDSFARTGRPPAIEDERGLRSLHDAHHIVLDGTGRIAMAHPFSAVPLGFSVMGRQTLWWGGCAWDSFALPNLLDERVLVATACPACDTPHAWNVGPDGPPGGDQVAHFLVPVARMWDDVVHTCRHQRVFCEEACVAAWLAATGNPRGYVMDLSTLWRLAAHWYDGRLARGYTRRDPAEAVDYLRGVGLSGPFWAA